MSKIKKHIFLDGFIWVYFIAVVTLVLGDLVIDDVRIFILFNSEIIMGAMLFFNLLMLKKIKEVAKYDITVKTQRDSSSSLAHVDNAQEHTQ